MRTRKKIRREVQRERVNTSFLGQAGKALEPISKWAGFSWRVNVALLSALAAKENTVATLGALYQEQASGYGSKNLEQSMAEREAGFSPLHALALMLFMVLYPPCLAALIAIKLQTGRYGYMLLSLGYQICLGMLVAGLVFTGGSALGLSGLQTMFAFYGLALALAVVFGLLPNASLQRGGRGENNPIKEGNMRKLKLAMVFIALLSMFAGPALAHTPLCSCWDNGDGTVTCEGGFSDGSSATGVAMYVLDQDGEKLVSGKMDEYSEFSFERPDGEYTVLFDAGQGHKIKIKGKDIY
jgi:hypothetical protein